MKITTTTLLLMVLCAFLNRSDCQRPLRRRLRGGLINRTGRNLGRNIGTGRNPYRRGNRVGRNRLRNGPQNIPTHTLPDSVNHPSTVPNVILPSRPNPPTNKPPTHSKSSKPNIIYIMVDDLGWNDIGYRPNTDIKTPTLTKLATNKGVRLENYYTAPTCGPTRAQFLSGKYTIHLGLQDSNLAQCTNESLDASLDTVADKLKAEGYATHLVGKWHAGFNTINHFPTYRGFDTFRGFLLSHSANHYDRKSRYDGQLYYDYHNDVGTNIVSPYTGDDGLYSTTAFTNRAVELIDGHDTSSPMFLYLAYQAPHTPIETESPDTFDSLYSGIPIAERRQVASMISSIDAGVERLVKALKNNGMYENTYIVFTSDNGGSDGAGSSTWPLRGGKGSYYEGGIRNVGFVHSPLMNVPDNTERKSLIHVSDWMPTFMHIATGVSVDGSALGIDGVDQFSTITSGTPARSKILHNIQSKQSAGGTTYDTSIPSAMVKEYNGMKLKIITGRQKGDVLYPNPMSDYAAWDNARQTHSIGRGVRLFNLDEDPSETKNLSWDSAYSSILQDLLKELNEFERGAMHPIASGNYGAGSLTEACDPAKHGGVFSFY